MSIVTGDDEDEVAADANRTIRSVTCEDRGERLKPRHVYVDGSGKCQYEKGPELGQRKAR